MGPNVNLTTGITSLLKNEVLMKVKNEKNEGVDLKLSDALTGGKKGQIDAGDVSTFTDAQGNVHTGKIVDVKAHETKGYADDQTATTSTITMVDEKGQKFSFDVLDKKLSLASGVLKLKENGMKDGEFNPSGPVHLPETLGKHYEEASYATIGTDASYQQEIFKKYFPQAEEDLLK